MPMPSTESVTPTSAIIAAMPLRSDSCSVIHCPMSPRLVIVGGGYPTGRGAVSCGASIGDATLLRSGRDDPRQSAPSTNVRPHSNRTASPRSREPRHDRPLRPRRHPLPRHRRRLRHRPRDRTDAGPCRRLGRRGRPRPCGRREGRIGDPLRGRQGRLARGRRPRSEGRDRRRRRGLFRVRRTRGRRQHRGLRRLVAAARLRLRDLEPRPPAQPEPPPLRRSGRRAETSSRTGSRGGSRWWRR